MKYNWEKPFETIQKITGEDVIVKDSNVYESANWVHYMEKTVLNPVQRKLTSQECVLDFDNMAEASKIVVINYLKERDMKFIAWDSSPTGMHVHFWTEVYGKNKKKKLCEFVAGDLHRLYNVDIDLNPMSQGCIRAEYSVHPTKATQKTFKFCNFDDIYMNEVSNDIGDLLTGIEENVKLQTINTHPSKTYGKHGCVKYMESNKFTDGRKRIMFCLISYYKNTMSDASVAEYIYKWTVSQDLKIHMNKIRMFINANNGTVGCSYRHNLLDELGHTYKCGDRK